MAGVLLLWESWWGGRNTYEWILKSSSAFFAKWPCKRNDLVCILVWKWMMDIGRKRVSKQWPWLSDATLNWNQTLNQSEHKLAIKVLTDMYVEFVDLFWDFWGLNTKASKTVNIIFECCVYLKWPHRMAFKILVRVLWVKLSKMLSWLTQKGRILSCFCRFLVTERQSIKNYKNADFDEIGKSRLVTWTFYVSTWRRIICPNILWIFLRLKL